MSDLVGVVKPEDFPPSVLMSADIDPLADGIFMAHQRRWCEDKSDIKWCEKGRRTGITWAEAFDDTITAASARAAGGDNIWYIGDTKDKGLEFVGYCANFARIVAKELAVRVEEFLFEDKREDGSSKFITAFRITFASGFRICALSSRPENIRGLQGIVVVDEAAFHQNVQAVIDSATALLIWGGKIRVISSHNGTLNPFNDAVEEIRAGKRVGSLHRYTFADAIANGLYERVCLLRGWTPTEEGKREWEAKIRGAYREREVMEEELDAIPREGEGVYLTRALIQARMRDDVPVIRLEKRAAFAEEPEEHRRAVIEEWCDEVLGPVLADIDPRLELAFGLDFGRVTDLTVFWPLLLSRTLRLLTPFVLELRNIPFEQQKQILFYILSRLRRFRGAMDATGNGAYLAEVTAQRFGSTRVEQIKLSLEWYRDHMPKLKAALDDDDMTLPRDADTLDDFHLLQRVKGVALIPPGARTKGRDGKERHGDSAVAAALAVYAAREMEGGPMEWTAAPTKVDRWSEGAPGVRFPMRARQNEPGQWAGKGGAW